MRACWAGTCEEAPARAAGFSRSGLWFRPFWGVLRAYLVAWLFGTQSVRGYAVHRLPPGHSYPAVLRSAIIDCCQKTCVISS